MIIHVCKKDVLQNKRYDIYDENNNIVCWSQNDFSYKNRRHFYDSNNNEFGYSQIEPGHKLIHIYNQDGKPFGLINFDGEKFYANFANWNIYVEQYLKIVNANKEDVVDINCDDQNCYFDIKDNKNDLNVIIYLFSLSDFFRGELL